MTFLKNPPTREALNYFKSALFYSATLILMLLHFNSSGQACKPIITVSGTLDPCDNTSFVTITAIAAGSTSTAYLWTGGATTSTINATAAGTYTVTVTYNVGGATCSGTASIDVVAEYKPLTVDGPRSSCRTLNNDYEIINPTGTGYTWTAISGIVSITPGTGTTSTINFTGTGTAVFTISYTEGTCNRVETLYVYKCCDAGAGNTTLYDTETSSLTSTLLTNHTNTVTINGILRIDGNYTISNCPDIRMAGGSEIIVMHGCTLTVTKNTRLHGGCDEMWKGIYVENGASLRFADGSILEDAEVGIDLQSTPIDPCDLELTSGSSGTYSPCLLQDNYIDLRAKNSFTVSVQPISNATFSFSGAFKTPYTGQLLVPTNKPFAAIVLEDVASCQIGDNTGTTPKITIEKHGTGIFAKRSSFTVENTVFIDISTGASYGAFPGTQNGWGIYAEAYNDQSMTIAGMGNSVGTSPPTFLRCKGGIEAKSMSTDIQFCIFDDVEYGVYTRLTQTPSTLYCAYNVINCKAATNDLYGVFPRFSGTSNIYVLFNEFNINGTSASSTTDRIGIYQDDVAAADNTGTQIYMNDPVNLINYADEGISLSGARGGTVQSNMVYSDQTVSTHDANCYSFVNANGTYVTNNYANDATSSVYRSNAKGYFTERSTGWLYQCNSSYLTGCGFRFNKNCASAEGFEGNYMSDNAYGVYIEDNSGGTAGKIGAQTQMGNKWNLSPPYQAIIDAAIVAPPSVASASPFTVHAGPSFALNPNPKSMTFNVASGTPYECADNFQSGSAGESYYLSEINQVLPVSMTGSITFDNWYHKRTTYASLDNNPAVTSTNAQLNNFYNTTSNEPVGMLYQAGKSFRNYQSVFAQINTDYRSNDSIARAVSKQLMQNKQLLNSGTLSIADSTVLAAANTSLLAAIENAIQNKVQLENEAQWYRETNIQNAQAQLAGINPVLLFDANEKTVMDIYLRTVASGIDTFSTADANTLLTIGQQCVSYGGMAVYDARTLYKLIDPAANFDDSGCNQLGQRKGEELKGNEGVIFMPNPTSDKVSIVIPVIGINETAIVEIFNVTGSLVSKHQLTSADPTIDVSGLNSGLYLIKVITEKYIFSKKLQIIKN